MIAFDSFTQFLAVAAVMLVPIGIAFAVGYFWLGPRL